MVNNEKLYGLNARDLQRVQKAVRFVEDNATTFKSFRRVRGQAGTGGNIPPLMCEEEEETTTA